MEAIEYTTCLQNWADDDVVVLQVRDKTLARIPLAFLRTGSPTGLRVSYLVAVIGMLLDLPSSCSPSVSYGTEDIDLTSTILPGVYSFALPGDTPELPRPGPQGKSKIKPFRDSDGFSTVSDSARSSINQGKLRENLLLRDGGCIATGMDECDMLIAAHIVPMSLGQDFLDSLTGIPRQVTLYSVTGGLLLTPTMHHAYDRFMWSIYVEDGRQYIHTFCHSFHELHGKSVHYGSRNGTKLPNLNLLRWHFTQCVLARIRGYYVEIPGQWFSRGEV